MDSISIPRHRWIKSASQRDYQNPEQLSTLISDRANRFRHLRALSLHDGEHEESFTYGELKRNALRISNYLLEQGICSGDRIAILSESRPRWGLAFFSILSARAIAMPLDPNQSEDELRTILDNGSPRMLLVSARHADLAKKLHSNCDSVEQIFSIDPVGAESPFASIDSLAGCRNHARSLLLPNTPVVLSYTSGTMGLPKGVLTSYGNLVCQVKGLQAVMQNDSNTRCVSILPLNHLFELSATLLTVLYGGGQVCYVNSLMPEDIARAMQRQRPTCMVVVPLFLKLIRKGILARVAGQPRWKRGLFHMFFTASSLLPRRLRRLLFRSVHNHFGGSLEFFACGGAPLDRDTIRFFDRIGIPVYQGYGMAEASPVITTNAIAANRAGSVGRRLPGVEVKIADSDGEILTRGPHVMRGYLDNPEQTEAAIDPEGWLHTGDIGYLDQDGYLYISGRKKNIIVLGNGKNVHPEELESVLFDHADIEEGCIIGVRSSCGISNGTEILCAVVVPNTDLIEAQGIDNPELQQRIEHIVATQADRLATWKRPARIVLSATELPKTATRKIRRREVVRQIAIGA